MKKNGFRLVLAFGLALGAWYCSSDSSSNSDVPELPTVSEQPFYIGGFLIDPATGAVSDVNGTVVGQLQADGTVTDLDGNVAFEADTTQLPVYTPGGFLVSKDGFVTDVNGTPIGTLQGDGSTIVLPDGTVVDLNGNVVTIPDGSETEPGVDTLGTDSLVVPSSSSVEPVIPGISSSSFEAPVLSSSSEIVYKPGEFKDISAYPVANYANILGNGKTGWNTRYWDACKPHCSWISNGAEGKTDTTTQESYEAHMTTARNCNIHDVEVPTFTLGHAVQQYWMGFEGTTSACKVGAKGVFTCTDMAPIAVNDTLSYAYVAGPSNSVCGKCYHLQYNGSFKDESSSNKPKDTHKALAGKHIVVMSSNIGYDVKEGQFDLMVPGGGVGLFDALSTQVNGAGINWGPQYGGFLTECQSSLGYDASLSAYQTCVKDMCDAAFGNAGFPNLLRGCYWFADWYMAADNPTYNWEEVECPQYLIDHYMTTINTEKSNRYEWRDDWSTYNQGDVLDTLECLSADYPQGCNTNK